ncbi:arylamine N-acetyltransferase family protein [Haloglomus litoreum]|uniref:arylamine N-acetyltransferase family protein n=1 Tax=Haloglomus litoreum TaxID=3034026 RepID=UPI0023E8729E|nr:arylamine N-acetyltransferase [Haloglomus sp. DT116]
MEPHVYLERFGGEPLPAGEPDAAAVATLQEAHVRGVPFETLSVAGDPFGSQSGGGVRLDLAALFEKVVVRGRGGYCYELNGLFGWLLDALGVEQSYVAAKMLRADGEARPPANHLVNLVTLADERYLVDVGLGTPTMRRPLPLDGRVVTDDAGVAWRVVGTERPDAHGLTQYRCPRTGEWTDRYLFETTARSLDYFAATNDHLSTAPESPFTGSPVVTRATADGHVKLTPTQFVEWIDGEATEHPVVGEEEWRERLREAFDIDYPW